MKYFQYPRECVEDIARLRRRIAACGLPSKWVDRNLIIGTWNIRAFGRFHPGWDLPEKAPRRNLRAMASIVEIIRNFDVIAIQEVKRDTRSIRALVEWLGPSWSYILSDVSAGDEGNEERLAYVYDRRRVEPSGLAGEIVLPATRQGEPMAQFARAPYIVGFQSCGQRFVLLTAHIKYGKIPADRVGELRDLAGYVAREIRDRIKSSDDEESNLIILGDFNIDKRGDNPLFQAFISTGLVVPEQLQHLRTAFGTQAKYYDQIAWFMGSMDLPLLSAGVVDFAGAVMPEISLRQMSYRVSDHLPLYAEFLLDRSDEQMAPTLGLHPDMPNPLDTVPDAG